MCNTVLYFGCFLRPSFIFGILKVYQDTVFANYTCHYMLPKCERDWLAGLRGPGKLKRKNLAISIFKKCQILKNDKGQIKAKYSLKIC